MLPKKSQECQWALRRIRCADPIVMALRLSVRNDRWWADVALKQDTPDYLQLDLPVFGLPEISLIS